MGVATSKSELELNHIVSKVLREIRYSGVDLSLYTGLAPGGRIEWVAMTDCDRPVVNLATR